MKMLNMFVAGFTTGAIIDSIYKNNFLWWTLWLIIIMIFNLYFALEKKNNME